MSKPWRRAADAGSSDATAPSGVGEHVRMCGSRAPCSHDPAAPTPDNGLGGCGECEPHSDATPTPNAAPDVVMSDACSSSVERSPEAALQGLVGALRARHNPPPGQRAVTTNGWKAVDELELIMRRWRATLDRSKKSEVTVGKRKADTCKMHFSRLRSDLHERLPPQIVEAICNRSPPSSSVPIPCALQ